jgi:hypothetical protein
MRTILKIIPLIVILFATSCFASENKRQVLLELERLLENGEIRSITMYSGTIPWDNGPSDGDLVEIGPLYEEGDFPVAFEVKPVFLHLTGGNTLEIGNMPTEATIFVGKGTCNPLKDDKVPYREVHFKTGPETEDLIIFYTCPG